MKTKTINGSSPQIIESILASYKMDGYKPTLAIVFASVSQDRQALCDVFIQNQIAVFGATTAGEFVDGHQSEGGIAVILMDLPREDFTIIFSPIDKGGPEDTAQELAASALRAFQKPSILFCSTFFSTDGKTLDGEALKRSLESVVGSDVNLFGGMAGDDLSFTGTYVFTENQSTDYGLIALVLDETKVAMQGLAISGWKPMGISRTITKSEGNLIYTIDHKPALETYLRYLGRDISDIEDQTKFFDAVGVHYPFQIEREDREPMMCNPIGYDHEKAALIAESNVPQGSRFRFSTPPDFDIIETVIQKAEDLKSITPAPAEALLIFSCVGRLSALGPMAQQENEGLQRVWNAPMAGFYTYGEFGRALNGKHEFHSTTCSWVVLSEK